MDHERSQRVHALTNSRLLARNTAWNLVGRFLPAAAALVCIPPVLRALGPDRFGILMLALTFVGYFGLLDLGLGRALTQAISEKIGKGREDEVPTIVWTGLSILVALSALGVMISAALTPSIIHSVLKVPMRIWDEAIAAFYVLALSIPFVILNAALWGTLAAYQRFDLVNRLTIPMGIAVYVGPLLILPWIDSLVAVMAFLLLTRAASCIFLLAMCLRVIPGLGRCLRLDGTTARRLMTFGGWVTLSSVMSPLMTSIDRFIIGSLLSVTAVTFYSAPYEVVTRIWVVSGALTSVLAPAFTVQVASRGGKISMLFHRALVSLSFILFPLTIAILAFAKEGLVIWLGGDFADHSVRVVQYLAAGTFFGSLALVPMNIITSFGRPDVWAKLQLLEVPLYLPVLYGSISLFGIEGAAGAWTARMLMECVAAFLLAARLIPEVRGAVRSILLATPMMLVTFLVDLVIVKLAWKFAFICLVLVLLAVLAWRVLGPAEREFILRPLRHLGARLRLRAQR